MTTSARISVLVAATTATTLLLVAQHLTGGGRPAPAGGEHAPRELVIPVDTRMWTIDYRAHDGSIRQARLLLPAWYGPQRNPAIPLVISPHGRGVDGLANAKLWGNLAGVGGFAVVNPDGMGRLLKRFSWGSAGQIDDLARMPEILREALPWLRIDAQRVYAVGGSMGGQETLLLVAHHPDLLAGAIAVDSLVDFTRQYGNFPQLSRGCNTRCERVWGGPKGERLQWLARREVGGSPLTASAAYARRSPLTYAAKLASSGVPLQIWWSRTDKIVVESEHQSGRLADAIRQLNPQAPLEEHVGSWIHTSTMRASTSLPSMLARFGLAPTSAL